MILSKPSDVIENKEVCSLLISDGAYQAISLQLKPYSFTIQLNDTQKKIRRYIDEGDVLDNIIEQERIVKEARAQDTQTC